MPTRTPEDTRKIQREARKARGNKLRHTIDMQKALFDALSRRGKVKGFGDQLKDTETSGVRAILIEKRQQSSRIKKTGRQRKFSHA